MDLSDLKQIPIWAVVVFLVIFCVLLIIALRSGREVSIWIFKIGEKTSSNIIASTSIKVYLGARNKGLTKQLISQVDCNVLDTETGVRKTLPVQHSWEAGQLTIFVPQVSEKDYLTIKVTDKSNKIWESESFSSNVHRIELN